jgi:hypothetical protein
MERAGIARLYVRRNIIEGPFERIQIDLPGYALLRCSPDRP